MRTLASGQAARLSIWKSRVRIPPSLPESRSSNGSGHESTELEIPVRIRSGIPSLGASSSGQDGALSMPRRGFDSPRARHSCWSGVTAATLVLETSAYGRESSNLSSSTKIFESQPGCSWESSQPPKLAHSVRITAPAPYRGRGGRQATALLTRQASGMARLGSTPRPSATV